MTPRTKAIATPGRTGKKRVQLQQLSPQTPSRGESSDGGELPPVLWVHDRHRLVWKLLKIMKKHDELRQGIWRRAGEPIRGDPKIVVFRQLARLLLGDEPEFPQKELEGHYGKAVKLKVWNLEVLYDKKVAELGGIRVEDEKKLVPGSQAQKAWELIRADCPFFFLLQELCADRERTDHRTKPAAEDLAVAAASATPPTPAPAPAPTTRRAVREAVTKEPSPTPEAEINEQAAVEEQLLGPDASSRKRLSRGGTADFRHSKRLRLDVPQLPQVIMTAFSIVLRGADVDPNPPRGDYRYLMLWEDLLEWVKSLRQADGWFTLEIRYKALTRDAETLMALGVRKEGDEVRDRVYDQSSYNAALQSAISLRRQDAPVQFVQVWIGEPEDSTPANQVLGRDEEDEDEE